MSVTCKEAAQNNPTVTFKHHAFPHWPQGCLDVLLTTSGGSPGRPRHVGACLVHMGHCYFAVIFISILLASGRTASPNYCLDEWLAVVITAIVAYR